MDSDQSAKWGEAIKRARVAHGMTVKQAAMLVRVSAGTWLRWERSAEPVRILPGLRELLQLALPELKAPGIEWPARKGWADDDPRRTNPPNSGARREA